MMVSSSLCSRCPEPRSASSMRCSSQLIAMTKRGIVELCHCEPQRTGVLLAGGHPTSSFLLAAGLKTLRSSAVFGKTERRNATFSFQAHASAFFFFFHFFFLLCSVGHLCFGIENGSERGGAPS
ncbi:hypothetical protein GE21DRAFT_8735 [Neurospora crassa]|uniref:Uncharacterized protein n=1 Tax=Neurospora crassa (strain ATCC 24698 / 74-OR23-1A / CBS 708.71 / DSM 1257 / FGSC 987) TaxID=367110 RepID=V5ILX2_NEUCR|nr:hypothetical protein NCU17073 [Neurospora crassa OR74A]ESA42129.1 hypothetical protein NCU17073 [Neurospora crassa OR74A]KHE88957.1 hypothetical protein GE21DRAFT_8735 [Neurospora crassa]|eukprot:XP_011395081.1 hypothetical protein NCU17073 [Neurospora crassa OR74A]